jgi:RNA polymerase sigma factor (sigma-70 family)
MEAIIHPSDFTKILSVVNKYIKGDRIDKEQLAIDIWIKLADKGCYDEKGLKLDALTYTIIKHKCYDRLRSFKRTKTTLLYDMYEEPENNLTKSEQESNDGLIDSVEYLDMIMECTSLSGYEKKLIFMYFYLGLNCVQIAEKLEKKEQHVQKNLRFTLDKLRQTVIDINELIKLGA